MLYIDCGDYVDFRVVLESVPSLAFGPAYRRRLTQTLPDVYIYIYIYICLIADNAGRIPGHKLLLVARRQ